MLAKVCSAAVNGIEAYPVEVEVNAGFGDTILVIVGLPDAAVKESRDRVMTALINSGFAFTFGRTTINLAPADVKKEGPSFDLPIAVAMLAASEQMESAQLDNYVMVGELALTGGVRPVKGVLPIALRARELYAMVPAAAHPLWTYGKDTVRFLHAIRSKYGEIRGPVSLRKALPNFRQLPLIPTQRFKNEVRRPYGTRIQLCAFVAIVHYELLRISFEKNV